jgi:hypothetical protein
MVILNAVEGGKIESAVLLVSEPVLLVFELQAISVAIREKPKSVGNILFISIV